MIGTPSMPAYSSARRMRCGSATGAPSSLKATAPACASSARSASSRPARPRVTQAMGRTRTAPCDCAVRRMNSTAAAESMGGSVLGMAQIVVQPPRAAASVPVAIVSLCSKPGSRRWQWMSTKPGHIMSPLASMVWLASRPASGPTAAIRPSAIRTSAMASTPFAGSMTRPPRMARVVLIDGRSSTNALRLRQTQSALVRRDPSASPGRSGGSSLLASCEQVKYRHADGDAVGHLLFDHRLEAGGERGRDLDAFIHRAGVHDECAGVGARHAFFVQLVECRVLADRGEEATLHALLLEPQRHDYVGAFKGAIEVCLDLDGGHPERLVTVGSPSGRHAGRHQRGWAADDHVSAHRRERPDVGAGDAAVGDIAHDEDAASAD